MNNQKPENPSYLFVLVILMLVPVFGLWEAFVLMQLWDWFIVPTFMIQTPGLFTVWGIALAVSLLIHKGIKTGDKKSSWESLPDHIAISIVRPSLALLFGYLATLFM